MSSTIPTVASSGADLLQKTAPLQEIFSSIQGEGILVGRRQLFVRFAHCHLKCAYCDTPMTSVDGQCHVETPPGSGETALYPNPMQPEAVLGIIRNLLKSARHHSVSFTGGEPLLYHGFLKLLLPGVQQLAPVYLETSGTQPEFLAPILDWVDIVAMDIKLPSSTGETAQWDNHARFYELCRESGKQLFIKLVFNEKTSEDELAEVRRIVTDRQTTLILQPETSLADRKVHIAPARMLELEALLSAHYEDVRVIPQTHKMLNVL